ncbi:MAG: FAD-dependent oxidoreductase [Promethearchaeota archaeon]
MKKIIKPQKEIDVLYDLDVIVVGGGPAGIGAALASGRNGAETILIETFGCLGGLQTQGYSPIFSFVDPELQGGIMQEILTRLKEAGAIKNLENVPLRDRSALKLQLISALGKENLPKRLIETEYGYWGVWGLTFDLEYYKFLIETMMQEVNVKILYHTFATDVIREENIIKGIIVESKEGTHAILGKSIIDCTGVGDIIWKSGAPCMGDEGIPAGKQKGLPGGTLNSFYIGGVDLEKFEKFKAENRDDWRGMYGGRKLIKKGKMEGAYVKSEAIILTSLFDVHENGRLYVMNPVHRIPKDKKGWMVGEISSCEIDMRRQAWAVFKLLKENIPGFEKAFIERTSYLPVIGVGHRIIGDYVLNVGDMREGKSFEDSIAINNMPPDLYETVGRFGYEILPHDIPYRCLVSKEIENLLAAGTTISAGSFANSGLRYCTPSICQGQAAGTAAALASKNNVSPKNIDVKLLQDTLRQQGVKVTVKDVPDEVLEPYRLIKKLKIFFKREDIDEMEATEEEIAKF